MQVQMNGKHGLSIPGGWRHLMQYTSHGCSQRHCGQAHIVTQADATQGRPGHGDAAREALRDTV